MGGGTRVGGRANAFRFGASLALLGPSLGPPTHEGRPARAGRGRVDPRKVGPKGGHGGHPFLVQSPLKGRPEEGHGEHLFCAAPIKGASTRGSKKEHGEPFFGASPDKGSALTGGAREVDGRWTGGGRGGDGRWTGGGREK